VKPIFAQSGFDTTCARILLLSYHFPPDNAAGSVRWEKMSHCLAEAGWQLDVIARIPPEPAEADRERLHQLPAGTRVFHAPHPDSRMDRLDTVLAAGVQWIRNRRLSRNRRGVDDGTREGVGAGSRTSPRPSSLPSDAIRWWGDPRILRRSYSAVIRVRHSLAWAREAIAVGRAVLDTGGHTLILTSGPPHVAHVAGRRLSTRYRLPLVIDFRDPWSQKRRIAEDYACPLWFLMAGRMERRAVHRAALVVANTPPLGEALHRRYPGRDIVTVMNGFDNEPLPPAASSERFVIAYAGAIYLDRDPRPLFAAVAQVIRGRNLTPDAISVELMGDTERYQNVPTLDLARDAGIDRYVHILPRRPRTEALAFLATASLLVNLRQDSRFQIPSKLFEYLRYPAWILALAEHGSPTETLLRGSRVDVVDPQDIEGIARVIEHRFEQYRRGERADADPGDVRYSRTYQAARLLEALRVRDLLPAGDEER